MTRIAASGMVLWGSGRNVDAELGEQLLHPLADLVADRTDGSTPWPAGSSRVQSS